MGYQTPTSIALPRRHDVHRFPTVNSRLHAGRSSFIHRGQSVYRTCLSKVACRRRQSHVEKIRDHAALPQESGATQPPVRKNHLGDLNSCCRPTTLRRVLRQPLPPQRREEPEQQYVIPTRRLPELQEDVRPRGVMHSFATDRTMPTVEPRWAEWASRRSRSGRAHQEAHGNLPTTISSRAARNSCQKANTPASPLRLAQLPHMPRLHAYQAREQRRGPLSATHRRMTSCRPRLSLRRRERAASVCEHRVVSIGRTSRPACPLLSGLYA